MSVILMTTLFYKALTLQGEIWYWSLLGLKGLKTKNLMEKKGKVQIQQMIYFSCSWAFWYPV